jgi:dihydrofolate reductase
VPDSTVARLKQQVDGEIVVYTSSRLVHSLIEHDLVDELRLITYPLVVGAGERVFGATTGMKPMRLVLLTYRAAPQP